MNSKFVSRSRIIFLGTIIAQAITFGTSFVITAFYTPEALGLLGTLGALISIIAGTLSFRLELAVIQSRKEDAPDVFLKSTLIGGMACTVFSLLCFLMPWEFAKKIQTYFIPFILWCWGYCFFFNSKQLPFRFDDLKYVSFGGIWRSSFTLVFQLVAGITNPSFYSLILGRISGDYVGALAHTWNYFKRINFRDLFRGWKKYIKLHADYFLYMAPHHLCLALSNNIIILFLENSYGLMIVGFYALAQRLIQAPLEIIGSTMQNVTTQRFGELKEDSGALRTFYLKVVALSFAVSLFLGAAIWGVAPFVIPLLGEKWIPAIDMVQNMVPYFMSTIFMSPTMFFLRFINKARLQLILEIIELAIKVGLLTLVAWDNPLTMVLAYGILSLGFSTIKTLIVFRFLSRSFFS